MNRNTTTLAGRAIALGLALGLALPAGGCATPARKPDGMPDRSTTRNVLIGVAAATVAIAVAGAVAGAAAESSLEDDLAAGKVSGDDYVDRDKAGRRWNRLSKLALFGAGLSLVGMALLWEASEGDRVQYGPIETSKPPPPLPTGLAPPSAVAQSWATAK